VTAPSAAAIFHRRVGTEAVDYNDLDWPVKLRDYGPQTVANGAREFLEAIVTDTRGASELRPIWAILGTVNP